VPLASCSQWSQRPPNTGGEAARGTPRGAISLPAFPTLHPGGELHLGIVRFLPREYPIASDHALEARTLVPCPAASSEAP
jgi:hypothetical protein